MMTGQRDFASGLLEPDFAAPVGLVNPDGAQALKRYDVYRNNVAVSLTEALELSFPVIRKLVGEANFKLLAGAFLRRHPPVTPILMLYGEQMPGFLEQFEPVQRLGYLPDVARLELALRLSYHAADVEPLDPVVLQQMPTDRLMAARVALAPAMRLVRSRWPVHSIWRFNAEDGAGKPSAQGENVLVIRPGYDPVAATLPPGGGSFVDALMRAERFGTALDSAIAAAPGFDLTETLGMLLNGGALIGLDED
ncbi:MAG: DUF2063 domain-containing protein [Rhodobacteraceae bacterium]|nr:DUF2063 domain-containing protein [Paracoccaceae bacterium]